MPSPLRAAADPRFIYLSVGDPDIVHSREGYGLESPSYTMLSLLLASSSVVAAAGTEYVHTWAR